MKTLDEWNNSNPEIELDQYLKPMDEIDEDLYMYMAEVVAPQFMSREFLQVGEADFERDDIYYYATFAHVENRYYYLGSLPEFVQ